MSPSHPGTLSFVAFIFHSSSRSCYDDKRSDSATIYAGCWMSSEIRRHHRVTFCLERKRMTSRCSHEGVLILKRKRSWSTLQKPPPCENTCRRLLVQTGVPSRAYAARNEIRWRFLRSWHVLLFIHLPSNWKSWDVGETGPSLSQL